MPTAGDQINRALRLLGVLAALHLVEAAPDPVGLPDPHGVLDAQIGRAHV